LYRDKTAVKATFYLFYRSLKPENYFAGAKTGHQVKFRFKGGLFFLVLTTKKTE